MQNFLYSGDRQPFTAGATIAAGECVVVGGMIVVAAQDYESGDAGIGHVGGVYGFTAVGTDTPAQGALAYWDATNKRMTTTSAGNTLAGTFYEAKANGVTTCKVRMRVSF